MKLFSGIAQWTADLFRVWRREFRLVFSDAGVMLFFFALPLAYPIVYSLIYNPEVVKDIPVAVVDECRTADSRHLSRMVDATEAMEVYDYVPTLEDARRLMADHKVYGILVIPSDYSQKLGSSEQANTMFYAEMDLLLRYRSFVAALTDIQLALGTEIQTAKVSSLGMLAESVDISTVDSQSIMLGDPTQGFASFVMPGIIILILQQSIVLGICMLMGGHRERLRRNGGYDPLAISAPVSATLLGRLLCYFTLYIPLIYYILHLLPRFFNFPQTGDFWQIMAFVTPFFIASVFFGMCVAQFVRDRESSLLVVVFSSVIFLFLSGLTWPRYAMNGFWWLIGSVVPATWGIDGFINMNSTGASLAEQSTAWWVLWGMTIFYFALAYMFMRLSARRRTAVAAVSSSES